MRPAPDSESPNVGLAAKHAQVRIECTAAGERVKGTQRTTNLWYRLARGMFVWATHVATVSGGKAVSPC